jgi:hypothetical protein
MNHTQELAELKEYFQTAALPKEPLKLNRYMVLYDLNGFIEREIQKLKDFQGSETVREYQFKHLRELKEIVSNHNNVTPDQ